MKNPYKVLGLQQDANNSQIARAQLTALRSRQYSQREIIEAQATLRKPVTRLAADFTFPVLNTEKVEPLTSNIKSKEVDLSTINLNKYNSLK